MARHAPRPNEMKYRINDVYARQLFVAVFREKHHLNIYTYSGRHKQTIFCDAEPVKQQKAWVAFRQYSARLARVLNRAVEVFTIENHIKGD